MRTHKDDVVAVRLPIEDGHALKLLWQEIRIASGYPIAVDLAEPEQIERFDAATFAEWIIPITEFSKFLVPAVLGYLVARRGEVEIGSLKFKNLSVEDIEKIVEIIKKMNPSNTTNRLP